MPHSLGHNAWGLWASFSTAQLEPDQIVLLVTHQCAWPRASCLYYASLCHVHSHARGNQQRRHLQQPLVNPSLVKKSM